LNRRIRYSRVQAGNPVINAVVAVAGALVIGAALVFGFFAFIFLASVVLVLVAIVGFRLWWVGRKLRKSFEAAVRGNTDNGESTEVIEGEYHVVSSRRKREQR
jgi:hypothetical protein